MYFDSLLRCRNVNVNPGIFQCPHYEVPSIGKLVFRILALTVLERSVIIELKFEVIKNFPEHSRVNCM